MRLRLLTVLMLTALSSCLLAGCGTSSSTASTASSGTAPSPTTLKTRPLTRLVFEDHSTQRLRWLDVLISSDGELSATTVEDVAGLKQLDAERQRLVQMRESEGTIVVGVRDNDEGKIESGWVLVDPGVRYDDHGDHGHWSFERPPSVTHSRLDQSQGNPAHVYEYGGKFFVANDRLAGYTRLDPGQVSGTDGTGDPSPRFIEGGGNHITLAVVDDVVGYSCWIDGGGPNKGRVDVTPLTSNPVSKAAYSFSLPTGGIHGAIANSGRVFLAPSDGVCWVRADRDGSCKPEEVQVHHVSLGTSDDKPRRTGAFTNHGKYVLCVTGKGADSQLALIDATAESPRAQLVPLKASSGAKVVTPVLVTTPGGDSFAMAFHDHEGEAATEDVLQIINLDPDKNGDCTDAASVKLLKVGPSDVDGHYGHHAIAFDADSRFGFITNPGDGTIGVISLDRLETIATLKIGGKPTAITACGGRHRSD
jgi:hypothetical protein